MKGRNKQSTVGYALGLKKRQDKQRAEQAQQLYDYYITARNIYPENHRGYEENDSAALIVTKTAGIFGCIIKEADNGKG